MRCNIAQYLHAIIDNRTCEGNNILSCKVVGQGEDNKTVPCTDTGRQQEGDEKAEAVSDMTVAKKGDGQT